MMFIFISLLYMRGQFALQELGFTWAKLTATWRNRNYVVRYNPKVPNICISYDYNQLSMIIASHRANDTEGTIKIHTTDK